MRQLGLGLEHSLGPAKGGSLWSPQLASEINGWLDVTQNVAINTGASPNEMTDWEAVKGSFGLDPFGGSEPQVDSLNGRRIFKFLTGDDLDEDASHGGDWLSLTNGAADLWMFTVIRLDSALASNRTIISISINSSAVTSRAVMMVDDSGAVPANNLQVGGRATDTDAYAATLGNSNLLSTDGGVHLVAARVSPGSNAVEAWVDGTLSDEDTSWQSGANTTFDATDSADVTVGDEGMSVGDIIVGAGVVNFMGAALRQKIEGYLAHLYQINNQLPTGHPWKSKRPTT